MDDGVIEPGEEIVVGKITLRSKGGLTLPKGTGIYLCGKESKNIVGDFDQFLVLDKVYL